MNNTRKFLNLLIDEIVPCLKNNETGQYVETVVFKIETRNFLKTFNKRTGWYEDWEIFNNDVDIFALATKEDMEVQGLVALENDVEAQAAFITWACTAPHNNKYELEKLGLLPKYSGIGGHLFAVAADKSVDWKYGGCFHGYASNLKVLMHYQEKLGAVYLGTMHRYHFAVLEDAARKLLEVYDYEWNNITEQNT